MNISLIIPAYNEEKYIGACLEKVLANGAGLYEVVVVNNASSDHTRDVVLAFQNAFQNACVPLLIVDESKKGLTHARQSALLHAHGDILAFIDADTLMPVGWVKKIQQTFSTTPGVVCVSGPYVYYDLNIILKFGVWLYWVFFAWPTYFMIGYMAVGGNFAARKSALISVGGFDSTIAFYGEDTDIARRLSKAGKVKFLQRLCMYTSARRLVGEGVFITGYRYVTNFFSIVFHSKPREQDYKDIR